MELWFLETQLLLLLMGMCMRISALRMLWSSDTEVCIISVLDLCRPSFYGWSSVHIKCELPRTEMCFELILCVCAEDSANVLIIWLKHLLQRLR